MNKFIKFFHELWNPHCEHCEHELIETRRCISCESLQLQLASMSREYSKLSERMFELNKLPVVTQSPKTEDKQVIIQTRQIPWTVRKQMLETESRERANALRNAGKPDKTNEINELENKLGIEGNAGNKSA